MSKTVFITCAALGREVKTIVKKRGWDVDLQSIDAKLHLHPHLIGREVDKRLAQLDGEYERKVVVYGHCGAFDLDEVLARHGAVRPLGPHCFEMYGSEEFAAALKEEAGSYILTDFLVRTWDKLVIQGLKLNEHPKLKPLMFYKYRRLVYFSQEEDETLVAKAHEIAEWMGVPLTIKHVGYGDLERRLAAIMEGEAQPVAAMTYDGYSTPSADAGPATEPAHGT